MEAVVDNAVSRTQKLKQKILDAPYSICIERARYVTEAFRKTEGMNPSWRAAVAFADTLEKMTVFILDEERIAGNMCGKLVGTLLSIERGDMNVVLEMDLDNLIEREEKPYQISSSDKRELVEDILPWWKGKTVREKKKEIYKQRGLIIKPKLTPESAMDIYRCFGSEKLKTMLSRFVVDRTWNLLKAAEDLPVNNPNIVNNVFDVQGHLVIGNFRVIKTGFKGVRDSAAKKLKSPLPEANREFLESVILCCDAAKMFAGRFAALAGSMAEKESDPLRREELLTIARHAVRVPWLPPRTFREALQFFWFTQAMASISYGMTGICAAGRVDQFLYPLYKKDIESGAISREEALELLEELLIKMSNNLIMLPSFAKKTGSEMGADSMAPTIGGLTPEGEDGTNELSFLFLDAIKNINGMSNSYSVRISKKTPQEFFDKVTETHRATSGLAIFNDEAIIPALLQSGCALEHARDYAVIGCVEPTPQGRTFGCTSGNDVSLTGALEMTLTNGKIRVMGRRVGPRTGDPATFNSFDDFMTAYKKQIKWSVDLIANCVNAKDEIYAAEFHNPFISSTLEGCVDNAEDMCAGGAQYNFSSISGRGLGTTTDSLAAIKRFVYDTPRISMKELLEALSNNFSGREPLRKFLETRCPRYGRDDDEADAIAREVAATFCDEVASHRSVRKNGSFRPGFFSYGMHVHDGSMLGATPDGRPAGTPVSNSLSPSNGAEIYGPTAAMRSAAKIDHSRISNGCSLNMKISPALIQNDEGRKKFESLVRSYFAMGGLHVQFNVLDNATLREAQLHPEKYRDLIVRVSGYVAYFTDLGRPVQDDIINRTEFTRF